jgi:chromosome segregation ATPase
MDEFLETSLSQAQNETDRFFIYQRAFDYVTGEFQVCRPLLERIKKSYDEVTRSLFARRRQMLIDTSSISIAEDTLTEVIGRFRRARTEEFSQTQAESERLLDVMTTLRLQRSELLKQLETFNQRNADLRRISDECDVETQNLNTQLRDILDEIHFAGQEQQTAQDQLVVFKTKLAITEKSTKDLEDQEKSLIDELETLRTEERKSESQIARFKEETEQAERNIIEMKRKMDALDVEKTTAEVRLREAMALNRQLEMDIRKVLQDDSTPIAELLSNVCGIQRQTDQ